METGKIIVMANQKGGVAKTSSTRNLAYSLAELGKKVLAVDFDPQTNLTISFGVAPAALQETTASLMMKLVMDEAMRNGRNKSSPVSSAGNQKNPRLRRSKSNRRFTRNTLPPASLRRNLTAL